MSRSGDDQAAGQGVGGEAPQLPAEQPGPAPEPSESLVTQPDLAPPESPTERVHVDAQRPPSESKYKTLEVRSFEVDAEDARRAATRRIERTDVQRYIDQYQLGGALPSNRPASVPPPSLPAPPQSSYLWLWAAVLIGAVVVGVLVGLALLEAR